MECQASPSDRARDADGRESGSHVLRRLVEDTPVLALGLVFTVVSPCITIEGGRVAMRNNTSAGSHHFVHMDVFAFSVVGAFASALSSITFRRSLPAIADVFEDVPVVFLGLAFASLVSVMIHEEFRWFAYVLCMVPSMPLLRRPWQSLFGFLAALAKRCFPEREALVQMGERCGSLEALSRLCMQCGP